MRRVFVLILCFFLATAAFGAKRELSRRPLPFSDWIIFQNVREPKSFDEIPQTLTGMDGREVQPVYFRKASTLDAGGSALWLNYFVGDKFKFRDRAVIYTEFESDKRDRLLFGYGAYEYSKLYFNGKLLVDCSASGNEGKHHPNDHKVVLKVRKGRNILAAVVEADERYWAFIWGVPSKEPKPLEYKAGKDYKPLDLSKITITADSALDLSNLTEAPAGKYGRIINRNGRFAYEKTGKYVSLLGFNNIETKTWWNIPRDEFEKNAKEIARAIRAQGYNYIRLHGLDLDIMRGSQKAGEFDPESLDRWDYLIAEFKKQGIYVKYVVFSYNLYGIVPNYQTTLNNREMHRLMFLSGRHFEREIFKNAVDKLLNHVNPYTKLAWKDDPVIAMVDIYNEFHAGHLRVAQVAAKYKEYKFFLAKWRNWLKARYEKADKLPKTLADVGFENAPVPNLGHGGDDLKSDYGEFLYEITRDANRWAVETIKNTGYKGLITNCHCTQLEDVAASWSSLPSIDAHTYFTHPSVGKVQLVEQKSSITDIAGCFAMTNATRISGRPFTIGEYLYAFWNKYQYEQPLTFGAYAALNGFSALEIFRIPVELSANSHDWNRALWSFSVSNSGVLRSGEFITAMLFKRGDLKRSTNKVQLAVSKEFLTKDAQWLKGLNLTQSRLGLLCNFSLVFPDLPLPEGVPAPKKAALVLSPDGVSKINSQEWFTNVIESGDAKTPAETVAILRKRGILPPENITDPGKGIYQSDTGELTLYAKEKKMTAITARTESIARPASDEPVKLDALTVVSNSADALIGATAVDNENLSESKRIVLVISTDNVNNRMKLSPNRVELFDNGKSPVLYRVGNFSVKIRNGGKSAKCYALNLAGDRKVEIPAKVENGEIAIDLDTGSFDFGATPFFEIVADGE